MNLHTDRDVKRIMRFWLTNGGMYFYILENLRFFANSPGTLKDLIISGIVYMKRIFEAIHPLTCIRVNKDFL